MQKEVSGIALAERTVTFVSESMAAWSPYNSSDAFVTYPRAVGGN
jgi:hypothetical protein